MKDYDFGCLTPHEFEVLSADLLSEHIGRRFERYKPGKDHGIDGRCFADSGKEYILQCKHWKATPTENLIRHLRLNEAPKVQKLDPERYFITTSKPLSHTDKKRLSKAFDEGFLAEQDIFGREDLNDILSKYPNIERRHFKLWIQSSSVLNSFLNNDVLGRSEAAFEEMRRQAVVYVFTENHDKALSKLQEKGTVILTGAPGVGKTTLAHQLLLGFVGEGFQLIVLSESISEAERMYDPSQKQIFYFDDFLGRNYLQALTGHEGNHIVQFMKRIKTNPTKRFVLTSRTTILNQAKILIDNLKHQGTDAAEFEIFIDSLSNIEKAQILYNHIWHSDLSNDHIQQLYVDQRYRDVISSDEFNPRLIRYMTDADIKSAVPANEYWQHVKHLLQDSAQIWEHPFEAQIDDFGRTMVLLVVSNSGPIREDDLCESYHRFLSAPGSSALKGEADFQISLRHLCGSLLSRRLSAIGSFAAVIDLFNPSIGDFVLARFARNLPHLKRSLLSLRGTGCVKTVIGLFAENLINQEQASDLLLSILENACNAHFIGFGPSLIADCGKGFFKFSKEPKKHVHLLENCATFLLHSKPPDNITSGAVYLSWLCDTSTLDSVLLKRWIISAYENEPDTTDIEELSVLCENIQITQDIDILKAKASAAIAYYRDAVSSEFDVSDIFCNVDITDLDEARRNLEDLAINALDSLGVAAEYCCVDDIVNAYDFEGAAHDLISSQVTSPQIRRQSSPIQTDEIEDIFGDHDPRFVPAK